MKKKFGQNFLINQLIVNKIVDISFINTNDEILEVGPGDGTLTEKILKKKPKKFVALEIDETLKNRLNPLFNKKENNKYELIFTDALNFNEKGLFRSNYKIISNLPYNISLQLLIKWIKQLKKNRMPKK